MTNNLTRIDKRCDVNVHAYTLASENIEILPICVWIDEMKLQKKLQ